MNGKAAGLEPLNRGQAEQMSIGHRLKGNTEATATQQILSILRHSGGTTDNTFNGTQSRNTKAHFSINEEELNILQEDMDYLATPGGGGEGY